MDRIWPAVTILLDLMYYTPFDMATIIFLFMNAVVITNSRNEPLTAIRTPKRLSEQ